MTGSGTAVVVVAYGRPDLLEAALAPLRGVFEVVVVDNSLSEDVQAVAARHGARYDRPPRNLGFAGGVNRALMHLPERDVLLLNPDAMISVTAVQELTARLRAADDLAAVGPRLMRPDGTEERSLWPLPRPGLPWRGALGLDEPTSAHHFLNGAVLLLRKEALASVGPFDERFFLYAEEADWQRRAQKAGWHVQAVRDVEAQHVGAGTSTDTALRDIYFHASAELFIRKWHGPAGWWLFCAGSVLAALRRWVIPGFRDHEVRRRQQHAMLLYLRGPRRALPPRARA